MPKANVFDMDGNKVGEIELSAAIFGIEPNKNVLHDSVKNHLANCRQGTQSALTKGEVSYSTRKPWKQKGTGRARQGSTRAPHFAGGGVVHGPTPRDYTQRTPKKMKAAALRGALSDRARNGRVHVVTGFGIDGKPSTKAAVAALANLSSRKNVLVVLERGDELTLKSLRNVEQVHLLVADQLNTYDVLISDDVVFTQAALEAFVAGPAKGPSATAVASSAEIIEEDAK